MITSTDWQVESVRITVFPEHYSEIDAKELWDQFIGDDPDKVQIERDKFDVRHKEIENRIVALIKQAGKIDWQYLTKQLESPEEIELPAWGSQEEELNVLLEYSKRWLTYTDIMPLNRLAFGATLLLPSIDLLSAYRQLKELLPQMDLENASDFNYQINRRRKSETTEDLLINRLSRWNVIALERNEGSIERMADGDQSIADRVYASRLELDINTVPITGSPLPTESLTLIFEELVQLGLEIAVEGDTQ